MALIKMIRRSGKWGLLLAAIIALGVPFYAQDAEEATPPAADIVNDEGGPTNVEGEMVYTFPSFTDGVAQPLVLLEDQAGFVARDFDFQFPLASQVLGAFTSDFYTSPVTYNISLPIEPRGTLVDVDNNDEEDTGVMVFTAAYWSNTFGDPFLEIRDMGGGGWSGSYAGTVVDSEAEIIGGKYIVYAPEEGQGFPSGFGEDTLLFTEDDPIVIVPQGWTIVDMDTDPFTFDRSATAVIDLLEPEGLELDDFSDMSYTEAFNATIDLFRREYSFTEYKGLDWDAMYEEFYPRIEEAEANEDALAFKLAMQDFTFSIPDGHVALIGSGAADLQQYFFDAIEGGIGMNIEELDDGRIIVSYILDGGPADMARIQEGDEIIALDGKPINTYLEGIKVYLSHSSDHMMGIQQRRYGTRFPIGTEVDVTYRNASTGELNTVALIATDETTTFSISSTNNGAPDFVGPVEFELLDNGYAYVQINTFSANEVLMIQDWEYFLSLVNQRGIQGMIIDMRWNSGGAPLLATQMAGYFYDEPTETGFRAFYNRDKGEFEVREDLPTVVYPAPEQFRFDGQVALLVGPACASACETFSYPMSLLDNVTVVGMYPSQGLGGGRKEFVLPEDLGMLITVNRQLNMDMEINIEGIGVVPDVRIPKTEDTIFSDDDLIYEAAVEALDEALTVPFTEGDPVGVNDSVDGQLVAGERVRHTITGPSTAVTIEVVMEENVRDEVVISIYSEDGDLIGAVNDTIIEDLPLLESVVGEVLIIEIGTVNDDITSEYTIETYE